MAPKSKKKGGRSKKKFDKLTVQERNAIIREKMAAEKTKRNQRKRLTKLFLKVKEEKEYALLQAAQSDLLTHWRPIMRSMKKDELLKDLKYMQASFERSFDKKNELIKGLEEQLRKNDKDYDDALDMHMYNLDKILEFFKKRIREVKRSYADRKRAILDALNDEQFRMADNHKKGMQYLQQVKNSVQQRYAEIAAEAKAKMQLREEEIVNKALEDASAARAEYEDKMNDVWEDIRRRLVSYDKSMLPLREEFLKLREMDDVSASVINTQHIRMQILKKGIASLDSQMDALKFAVQCYLKELQQKKSALRARYGEEQDRHSFHVKKSGKALRHLALTTHAFNVKLDEHAKKRERLLLVIERCRKQERLDEKVDPFMLHWVIDDVLSDIVEAEAVTNKMFNGAGGDEEIPGENEYNLAVPHVVHGLTCDCNPCICEFDGNGGEQNPNENTPINRLVTDYSLLERFWIRFNRVSLELGALTQRRDTLFRDNSCFKVTVRNYMGGMNPLEHDPEKLSTKALEEDRRSVGRFMKTMQKEYQRQKRSQQAGGIRMH